MSHKRMPMTALSVGERAKVDCLRVSGPIRRRMLDLGLAAGTEVTCLHKSPAGDPTAYLIRGGVIALRAEDAKHILICT